MPTKTNQLDKRTIILIAIVGVLLAYMGISPILSGGASLQRKIQAKKTQYANQLSLIERFEDLKSKFELHREKIQFSRGVTEEEVNAQFLKEVEGYVLSAGLHIVDVKVLSMIQKEGVYQFLIQMEFEGPMDQVIGFLHQMGTVSDLTRIENFSIERKSASSDTLLVKTVFAKLKI